MAASQGVAGRGPWGWRLASAVAGVATVLATYLIGRRLFRPRWAGALAALLVAVDGLALTMSRIAMLDGILAGFVAVGALFASRDTAAAHRRWRWAAGAALGVALSIKWSGGFALLAAIALAVAVDRARHRRGETGWPRALAVDTLLPLVVLPAVIYLASYAGWFANVDRTETARERCPDGCSITDVASGWAFEQWDMWDLQRRLDPTHPDRSSPDAWLTLSHPVLYYAEGCGPDPSPADDCAVAPGTQARIVGVGNPALWWPALAAYPLVLWAAIRRRDPQAGFIVAFLAAQLLPWLASWKPGFTFYMTPVVPFVALALVHALVGASDRWPKSRVVPAAVAIAALGVAVHLYPIWTGLELSRSSLDARLWFDSWR